MDRLLYVAMSGASQSLRAQAVNSQNLANASTSGFRADLALFDTAQVRGPGYASRAYTQLQGAGFDGTRGTVQSTGRDLDVAINGDGWIAVQAPDGSEAYTRRGDLQIDAFGLLTNGEGLPVLGNSGPIAVPPHTKFEVGADGTITILPVGQNPNAMSVAGRIKLVASAPADMEKGVDGLLRRRDGQSAPVDNGVQLMSQSLETSNVNSMAAMVRMIELSRAFELQVKMMRVAADNDQASASLMSMS